MASGAQGGRGLEGGKGIHSQEKQENSYKLASKSDEIGRVQILKT